MLEFHTPKIEDREWVQPILSASGGMGSESAFGTLFIWSGSYQIRIARYEDFVLLRYGRDLHSYGFPKGKGDLSDVLELLRRQAQEEGQVLRFWGLSPEEKGWLESQYPGQFAFSSTLDDSDYVYESQALAELSGRKYHGKRNHIAKFRKQYAYTYEPVTAENLPDCEVVAREWCLAHGCGGGLQDENCAIVKTLENFQALGFQGGLIRVEGKPVAFTAGEEVNPEVFDIHFEKALDGYNGLYTVINQEFVSHALTGYRWVNREEDMGIPGLRKAKESYYPAFLLEKYSAVAL